MKQNRYIVVSDLHLTSGKDPVRGTWSPTEDFFWDEEFEEFLEAHRGLPRWTLIVNGDMFDFLQVLELPDGAERRTYGLSGERISPRFGLPCSEASALFQMDRIASGHPVAFGAIARFLRKGNRVVIIKGNHDVQLFWPSVCDRLIDRIAEHLPAAESGVVRKNLDILPWCYYVPGLLYCEHGNQYEEATSFSRFLYPVLPYGRKSVQPEIELDLGSLIIRYVSNRLEVLDPRTDNYRPLSAYLRLFFRDRPFEFLDTIWDALRYIRKTAAKAWRMWRHGRGEAARGIAAKNRELIAGEADRFSGRNAGMRARLREAFAEIASMAAVPTLTQGVNHFMWEQIRPLVSSLVWWFPLLLLLYVPEAADALRPFLPGGESLFFLRIPHVLIAGGVIGAALGLRKIVTRRSERVSALSDPVEQLRRAARRVEALLQVRFVSFGHSHAEDVRKLPGGGTYFNTGTWIGIYSEKENLYRNTLQFTYLRIAEGRGELLHWVPRGGTPRPAVVVDAELERRRGRRRSQRGFRNFFRRG